MESKEIIRNFHRSACNYRFDNNITFLNKNEEKLIDYFADGSEINIDLFDAKLQVVKSNTIESDLFRYASLLWSVPVSNGFGRRIRFLLWDKSNKKLIGIFALGDPVFNLKCRDNLIGWNSEMRKERLYNVMDVFVLGSVPPYNLLLGGKLIALVAASDKVRNIVRNKYFNSQTIIENKNKDSRLALLTTGSALGKSSLYDRIKFDDRLVYQNIGKSEGWGHFHFNHGLFEEMRLFLASSEPQKASAYKYGQGPNWKIRTARSCLSKLGLPENLMKHGIQREIYGIPLAKNYDEFLRGETNRLSYYKMPFNKVVKYWKERWLVERVKRKPEYKDFKKQQISEYIHSNGVK